MLYHFPFPIDRKHYLPGLQCCPTIEATRSFPGGFGSLQCIFKGMAGVGGHIRKDSQGYGQASVQGERTVLSLWKEE